ncbi:hypothetical protein ACHQM5_019421 [Ranunculus cassubicifolius]
MTFWNKVKRIFHANSKAENFSHVCTLLIFTSRQLPIKPVQEIGQYRLNGDYSK